MMIIPTLAAKGILMTALPLSLIGGAFVAAVVLAFVLDAVKSALFGRLKMV
jgi:H+-transporting ATPase